MTECYQGGKVRFARAEAVAVARELCKELAPAVERIVVAGSLRRRKLEVGDVEIVYIPKFEERREDLLGTRSINLADEVLEGLLGKVRLVKRLNVRGAECWGPKNKLARHVASGIPVDLFEATVENWHNYLVCRTGGRATNELIASEALRRGWKWNPYGNGFSRESGEEFRVGSERDVFEFVGLPYREPWQRE